MFGFLHTPNHQNIKSCYTFTNSNRPPYLAEHSEPRNNKPYKNVNPSLTDTQHFELVPSKNKA